MKVLASVLLLAACAVESSKPAAVTTTPPTPTPPTNPQTAPLRELGGLGVVLSDALVVKQVLARSGGCRAGLHVGDVIVEIDSRAVTGTDDALPLLRGAPGSRVTLAIERAGVRQTIVATRALIDASAVDTDCTSPGALASVADDFDGDGKRETIALVSTDAQVYWHRPGDSRFDMMLEQGGAARLVAGGASWPITLARGDYVGVRAIDIDASDGRREVMLVRRAQHEEDADVFVFVFDGARLHATTLARGSWTHVDGGGTLVVEQAPVVADMTTMLTTQTRIHYRKRGTSFVEHARNIEPYHSD